MNIYLLIYIIYYLFVGKFSIAIVAGRPVSSQRPSKSHIEICLLRLQNDYRRSQHQM